MTIPKGDLVYCEINVFTITVSQVSNTGQIGLGMFPVLCYW